MGSKPRHISAGGSLRRIGVPWFESDEATRRRSHCEPRKLEEHATVAMAKGITQGRGILAVSSFEVPISYLIPV